MKKGFKRKPTNWELIQLVFWVVCILLFAVWMRSVIPFIGLLYACDLFWWHFVKWDWWKELKNGLARNIMSWVDAIVFALVAVWILQNFFLQNFQIPTTSLEKSMMAGDYLLVSKYHYGPRVPMTPLSLPLFQHTIQIGSWNLGKSYIENPQLDYERKSGLTEVKRGDIVVFNYPFDECQEMTDVPTRPVDRRENYVKRCIGLPGETFQMVDRQAMINGEAIGNPEQMQQMYFVYTNGGVITERTWRKLGVYTRGGGQVSPDVSEVNIPGYFTMLGLAPDSVSGHYNPLYHVNLTEGMKAELLSSGKVQAIIPDPVEYEGMCYPKEGEGLKWTPSNYGPLWIPKAGESIKLDDESVARYRRCITIYEGNTIEKSNEGWLLNGKPATDYTFLLNYYWMMGDNRDNSLDSRFWGFVPEDHIVGTPILVWFSVNQDTGEFRWDRFLKGCR